MSTGEDGRCWHPHPSLACQCGRGAGHASMPDLCDCEISSLSEFIERYGK